MSARFIGGGGLSGRNANHLLEWAKHLESELAALRAEARPMWMLQREPDGQWRGYEVTGRVVGPAKTWTELQNEVAAVRKRWEEKP